MNHRMSVLLVALIMVAGCDPGRDQVSCSSSSVLETVRAIVLKETDRDFEITNSGLLGRSGNVLWCSSDWEAKPEDSVVTNKLIIPMKFSVQPLDDGRFRIAISNPGFGPATEGVGPMSYADVRNSRTRQKEERDRRYREVKEKVNRMLSSQDLREQCMNQLFYGTSEVDNCIREKSRVETERKLEEEKKLVLENTFNLKRGDRVRVLRSRVRSDINRVGIIKDIDTARTKIIVELLLPYELKYFDRQDLEQQN